MERKIQFNNIYYICTNYLYNIIEKTNFNLKFIELLELDNKINEITEYRKFLFKLYKTYTHLFNLCGNLSWNYNNVNNINKVINLLIKYKNFKCIPNYPGESSWKIDFWIFRGWSENEAKNKVYKVQSNNSKKFREKHKQNPNLYKGTMPTQAEYYINKGFNKEDAYKKLRERQQTFTLEKCIKKYGQEKGTQIWKDRQIRWQNTLKSKSNYLDILIKRQNHKSASGISQELFDSIYDEIKHLNLKIYYAKLNHEYGFGIKKRGGVLYDFVIPELRYAIEFNGERFHPNKNKLSDFEWKNWFSPYSKKTADEIYKLDTEKNNALISKGYLLNIIWESEYKNNKHNIIKNCVNEIINLYERQQINKNNN